MLSVAGSPRRGPRTGTRYFRDAGGYLFRFVAGHNTDSPIDSELGHDPFPEMGHVPNSGNW
ncbi:MAG: hypothetical protein MZU84_06360 [Sphingobacterium sp.]|nr:hypothetical protein [Sphingobacterium sp.]